MQVVMVRPDKRAYITDIKEGLKSYQEIVGGLIQAIYPFEDEVCLVCNDEGKLNGLPLNRPLRDDEGNIYDIIAGTFFICGIGEEDFVSLSDELAAKYLDMFIVPQVYMNVDDTTIVFDDTLEEW